LTALYLILVFYWAWVFLAITVFGTVHTVRVMRNAEKRKPPANGDYPPISILKPLAGLDAGLEKNLESFFHLDYPEYEIIFSMHHPNDPAGDTARLVMERHPEIPAQLIISGPCRPARNPKVINTAPAFLLAKHEWVFMADSTLRLKPDFLKRCAAYFSPEVGSVSAVVTTMTSRGLGGKLEHILMNTFNVRLLFFGRLLGLPYVWGKAVLFRRSVAEAFGGLSTLETYLAEDFALGMKIQNAGYRAVLMDETAQEYAWASTFSDYWKRQLRWGRTRRFFSTTLAFITPTGASIFAGIMGGIGFQGAFGVPLPLFLAVHLAIWLLCDLWIFKTLERKLSFPLLTAWLLRELLDFPLWVACMSGSTVEWKGRKFRLLGKDTQLVQIDPPESETDAIAVPAT